MDALPLPPAHAPPAPRPGDRASHRLLAWLPVVGVGVALAALAVDGAVALHDRGQAAVGLLSAALLFAFGKEGSIPIGIANHGQPWLVAAMVWSADVASMCILYPLVERGLDEVERRDSRLGRFMATLRRRGQRRTKWAVKYGQLGLYGFMLIPFAFNGPLQSAVVGRLAGLRPSRVLPVLVAGITTTTVLWTLVAKGILAQFPTVNPLISGAISLGVGAAMVGVFLVAARRERILEGKLAQTQAEQPAFPGPPGTR